LVHCPNPEHVTNKRHFQINLDKPLVHCFAGCGISGTYEKAIAMILGVSEREARKRILKSCGVQLGQASKRKTRHFSGRVSRVSGRTDKEVSLDLSYRTFVPQKGLEYLDSRGITAESIAKWGIGWDESELRIVIPARDAQGTVRFLIKRAIRKKEWPKYLYTEGFPKTSLLFGACFLDMEQVRSQGLVVVEGSIDTIINHQHGIRNTVAILGTGISEQQTAIISRIRPPRIVTMFDADVAGWHNVQALERRVRTVPIFVSLYPKGKTDPAKLSRKEGVRAVDNAMSLLKFKQRMKTKRRTKEVVNG
jgi:DNA primase